MITTVHFLVGGAVGVATGNPYAAVAAGVASHFVCDSIPHLDVPPLATRDKDKNLIFTPAIWTQVWVDGVIGLGVFLVFWARLDSLHLMSPFLWGALGGFLPDLIDNVPFWNKKFRSTSFGNSFHSFHEWIHEKWHRGFPMEKWWLLGSLTQLLAVWLSLAYLLRV